MKKNGFVFVETLIVLTILSLGLISLYTMFYKVFNNEKRRTKYDTTESIYSAFYLKKVLLENNLSRCYFDFEANTFSANNYYKIISLDSYDDGDMYCNLINDDNRDYLANLKTTTNIKNIYLTKYNVNDLKSSNSLNTFNASLKEYIKTLYSKNDNSFNNAFRLIFEFNDHTYTSSTLDKDLDVMSVKLILKNYDQTALESLVLDKEVNYGEDISFSGLLANNIYRYSNECGTSRVDSDGNISFDVVTSNINCTIYYNNNPKNTLINNESNVETIQTDEMLSNYKKAGLFKETYNKSGSSYTTYYYRGDVNNNYFRFANMLWRIIRINEDNSMRVILQSPIIEESNMFNYSSIGENLLFNNANYTNNVLTILNTWKSNNLSLYTANIVNNQFCLEENTNFSVNKNSTGVSTLGCTNELTSDIGLITVDELIHAGINGKSNYLNYLTANANYNWWSLSSGGYNITNNIYNNYFIYVDQFGKINNVGTNGKNVIFKIRPVININKDVLLIGEGTILNPYEISGGN